MIPLLHQQRFTPQPQVTRCQQHGGGSPGQVNFDMLFEAVGGGDYNSSRNLNEKTAVFHNHPEFRLLKSSHKTKEQTNRYSVHSFMGNPIRKFDIIGMNLTIPAPSKGCEKMVAEGCHPFEGAGICQFI